MAEGPTDHTTEPRLLDIAGTTLAVVHGRISPSAIRDFFDTSFARLATVLATQEVAIIGPALARYGTTSEQLMEVAVGFPVDREIDAAGEVVAGRLPAGSVARLVHHGSFDELDRSWNRLHTWISTRGSTPGDARWEVYVTEPSPHMDPADLRTELNWSIAPE